MKKYKYYKCSVEAADEYKSVGFILKDNGKSPEDKLSKFFKKNNSWIKYDGIYLPLTECSTLSNEELNYVFKETMFGIILWKA